MPGRIALTNARVLTCSGDPSERPFDGDVLIEGNQIVAVSAGRLDVGDTSTRTIDLHGATLLPGLCDAHTHISWPLDFEFDHGAVARAPAGRHALDVAAVARTYLESGYTLIIGAGATQPEDDLMTKDAVERGLLVGPRIYASGAMISEPGAIGAEGGLTTLAGNAADLRRIVADQCEAGVQVLKLFISGDGIVPGFPSQDTYMNDEMLIAAVEEAERHGAFVSVHARSTESVKMAARTGVRLIHHATFLDDTAIAALESRRDDVWVCPGLHYLYAMATGQAAPWGVTPERIRAAGYDVELQAQIDGLRKLKAAGVRILAGGDFGHQWTHHGTYAAELQRYVDLIDMTPIEAIHTATSDAGTLVGLKVGQVSTGYLADLLAVDGDPSDDVGILQDPSRRRAVFKDGKVAYVNPELYP